MCVIFPYITMTKGNPMFVHAVVYHFCDQTPGIGKRTLLICAIIIEFYRYCQDNYFTTGAHDVMSTITPFYIIRRCKLRSR